MVFFFKIFSDFFSFFFSFSFFENVVFHLCIIRKERDYDKLIFGVYRII
jgi:hypothetical protein